MARTKDEALHEQRRLQILAAAAGLFRQKGFHATRTEAICSAAGMSAGSVFRYFPSKEAIILAIAEQECRKDQEDIQQLGTRPGLEWLAALTPEGLTQLLGASTFELGLDSWLELYRNPHLRPEVLKEDRALRERLADALRKGQEEGWVRGDLSVEGVVSFLFTLFVGMKTEQQLAPELRCPELAGVIARFFRTQVLAPE